MFVYGSLRRACAAPSHALIAEHCAFVATAHLNAQLFEIDGYPGAVASDDPRDRVTGELYRIHDEARLFATLDDYEECSARFVQPHEYRRAKRPVTAEDGRLLDAWTYLYNRPTAASRRIVSGDYLDPGPRP
nr:gamma-glutamylcyclotransferase family protein [Solimonas terrae]